METLMIEILGMCILAPPIATAIGIATGVLKLSVNNKLPTTWTTVLSFIAMLYEGGWIVAKYVWYQSRK